MIDAVGDGVDTLKVHTACPPGCPPAAACGGGIKQIAKSTPSTSRCPSPPLPYFFYLCRACEVDAPFVDGMLY